MSKLIDLTGNRYNMLTVVGRANVESKRTHWMCQCDCGKEVVVNGQLLKTGNTKSCGCLNHKPKHNLTKTRIHRIWTAMKQRCNNPKSTAYERYGGRGIKVCEEWNNKLTGSLNFIEWALSNGYSDNLTIDRIDGTKGYSPNNCRWADKETQTINRNTRKISKTGVKGVYHDNNGGFYAQIMFMGKRIHLGTHATLEKAIDARKNAEEKYFEAYLKALEVGDTMDGD